MKQRIQGILLTAGLVFALLTGCGNRADGEASGQADGADRTAAIAVQEESVPEPAGQAETESAREVEGRTPEERAAAFVPQMPQHIQEDEDNLYFIYYDTDYNYSIYRQAKADGGREALFLGNGNYIDSFSAAGGNLYVYTEEALWFVDGGTKEREKILEEPGQIQNLCVKDGLLYFEQKDMEEAEYRQIFYELEEDGRPGERLSAGKNFPLLNGSEPEEFWRLETEEFGVCIREGAAYYAQRNGDGETDAARSLICEGFPNILYYDESALYVGVDREPREESEVLGTYEVLRFDRGSFNIETVCSIPDAVGHNGAYVNGPTGVGILGDRIYYLYLEQEEGKDYLASAPLGESGAVTKIGEPLFTDPAAKLGSLSVSGGNIYCPVCGSRDWYWRQELVLEEEYPGDARINAYLQNYYQEKDAYARKFVEESSAWEDGCIHDGISTPISSEATVGVVYNSGRYLNLMMNSYEYGGGAHGMPMQEPLLFDRETGERLKLSDVIGNTEEELKTMVADAFCNPPYCGGYEDWASRREDVYAAAGLDMLFHLSGDGITFYFTPYEVASYAEGFPEMTIPYGKLHMKITL